MKKTASILALSAAATLAACSGPGEQQQPVETNLALPEETVNATVIDPLANAAPPPAPATNLSTAPATAPIPPQTDAQVQEDAEAVGMTARLPREGEGDNVAPPPAQ